MEKKRKKRRQPHGSARHWKQTDCWYFTMPGAKKRVPLFDEEGERIRGKENKEAAELALAKGFVEDLTLLVQRQETLFPVGYLAVQCLGKTGSEKAVPALIEFMKKTGATHSCTAKALQTITGHPQLLQIWWLSPFLAPGVPTIAEDEARLLMDSLDPRGLCLHIMPKSKEEVDASRPILRM